MKGSTYTLPDGGDYARDFTYAPDAAKGIYLAYSRAAKESRRFNIASGQLFTLREVAEALNRIYPAARLSVAPGRFEGHVSLAGSARGPLDISKAKAELGFCPGFSLIEGLRAYTSFLQSHPSLLPA
jgi:nucleoside-diphosphate-sugar epimerase